MHYVTYSQTHIAGGTILNNRIIARDHDMSFQLKPCNSAKGAYSEMLL